MPQTTDIALDGAGYMVTAYTRAQDGMADGRSGRVSMRDFFGGQRRAIQLERDKAGNGLGVGPVNGGQGVQPWGNVAASVAMPTFGALPSAGARIPSAFVRDVLYFAVGSRLYRTQPTGGGWTAPTLAWDATDPILDLCIYASDGVLMTFGPAREVTFYSHTSNATQVLAAGEYGYRIASYAGYAIWSDARPAGRPSYLRMVTGSGVDLRLLDHDIIGFANAGAELYAITKQAIYSYSGRVKFQMIRNPAYDANDPNETDPPTIPGQEWSGEFSPFFQQGVYADADDFAVFVGYGGRIHAWVAGRMMEHNPSGERAGWRETGLEGRSCFGGTVAGGYVVVSIESVDGFNELWAWDGGGWWRVTRKVMAATGHWIWPTALCGVGQRDVLLFRHGEQGVDLVRLQHRSPTVHAFTPSATFTTPLLDANERDKAKAWRKIGAVFATGDRNGNLASTDPVTVALDVSLDAGETWTTPATRTLGGNTVANNAFALDAELTGTGNVSRFVLLRVRWSSVADWAPVLAGIWAEFDMLDAPVRRRRWTIGIQARDQQVDRAGGLVARSGQQLVDELWQAWQSGSVLAFRDIDHDASPVERTVRLIGINEKASAPYNAGQWADSVVTLQLVEV